MKLTIPVAPEPKQRARTVFRGGKVRTYTPSKTVNTEQSIRWHLGNIVPLKKGIPVFVDATFYRAKPKSVPNKNIMPTQKPDLDNYHKLLLDAIEGYAFENDSQVTTMVLRKRYGMPPRIELIIEEDKIE